MDMGQAKKRGTPEQRSHAAIEKREFFPLDLGSIVWNARKRHADRLEQAVLDIAAARQLSNAVTLPYRVLLRYMWECEYRGACHSTSAVLFVLLSELGLAPKLCIGEVGAGGPYFDHSWVELDGEIFDVAVSLPELDGREVGGPVFASVDLYTGTTTDLDFAFANGEGLAENALVALNFTLERYAEAQSGEPDAGPDIWRRIVHLAPQVGLMCTASNLIAKYGEVMREYRRGNQS